MANGQVGEELSISMSTIFVKGRIASGKIEVDHCGTENMVADFFTKPLQGALFRKFRALILNLDEK
eukprot:15367176-Ditylum_brightwellii.AAC.2